MGPAIHTHPSRPAIVVGGGWAGLAAAVELTGQGVPVLLLESGRQLGGRARCVRFRNRRVDNGQHLMIGAYRSVLALMDRLGLEESEVLLRRPLSLTMRSRRGRDLRLRAGPWPAPLHLLSALLGASGIPFAQRIRGALAASRLLEGPEPENDTSVAALLKATGQPPALVRGLWEPLCLGALNTPIDHASARLFHHVLDETFRGTRDNSDFLFQRTDLGTALPVPALDFIESNGGKVTLGSRVVGLQVRDGRLAGLEVRGRGVLTSDHVILAVPSVIARRLLAPHPSLRPIAEDLGRLSFEPVCTVYLQYPEDTRLETEMMGLEGSVGQWIFDRSVCGQPGMMAVVVSGDGPHMSLDGRALADRVLEELGEFFPDWPRPEEALVIREKRATFSSRPGVDALRPAHDTPIRNLWLAGDYTNTGLPATLEGAVRSGLQCAHNLLGALS